MAAPNISDKVNVKYCISKIKFTKTPSTIQYFNIYYKLYDSDEAAFNLRQWLPYAMNVGVNPDGSFVTSPTLTNIVKNGKLFINNLSDYKEYCIKFVNAANNNLVHEFKFKTGYAMTLKDSPYYKRVLFPGEEYSIHVAGTDSYTLPYAEMINGHPNPEVCSVDWYFPLDSHKYEKRFFNEEYYSSFIPALFTEASNNQDPTYTINDTATFEYLEVTDAETGEIIVLHHCNTKNNNSVLLCPFLRNTGPDQWEPHIYYDCEDGAGSISLSDIITRRPIFVAYIDSNSNVTQRCIYHWDTRAIKSLGTPYDTIDNYCYVYINSDGTITCKYWDNTTYQEKIVTSTVKIPFDKFIILDIFNHRFKYYGISQEQEQEEVDVPIESFTNTFKAAIAFYNGLHGQYEIISNWMTIDDNCDTDVLAIRDVQISSPENVRLAIAYYREDLGINYIEYTDFHTGALASSNNILTEFKINSSNYGQELALALRGGLGFNTNSNLLNGNIIVTPSHGTKKETRWVTKEGLTEWQNIDINLLYSYNAQRPGESDGEHSPYLGKIPGAFVFGGPNSEKIYVGQFTSIKQAGLDPDLELKLIRPSLFKATIKITLECSDNTSQSKVISNPSPKDTSISFTVPLFDELFNKEIIKATLEIVAGGNTEYSEKLFGLQVGNNIIAPYVFPEKYIYDNFDADFKSLDSLSDKQNLLKEMFFTKHGSWGGYNGGVNGHNCYFNHDGVLVLENHGDKYAGSLKAVGKEAVLGLENPDEYTGYGGDLYVDYEWDTRVNKACLRTGTTLVSNKYFTYGKVDVWMKIPKGCYGVCPAIWFFHYIEVPEGDPRYDQYPYNERVIQGSNDDGHYRVVNNEIDIELPSHLTKGSTSGFDKFNDVYFDPIAMDDKYMIGIGDPNQNEDLFNTGLFKLIDPTRPYDRNSWEQVEGYAGWYPLSYQPSFQNCKFNNWQGEYNSGDGWVEGQDAEGEQGTVHVNAEDYYKGTSVHGENPLINEKEEYLAVFQHLTDHPDGMADGFFHKWSIEWLPDRTVLFLDDKVVRVNKGFIPFNIMKLTIGTWFPTMPLGKLNSKGTAVKVGTKAYLTAEGVYDQNGIYGTKKSLITDVNSNNPIGTWAGIPADWEVCQIEVSRVKYKRYNINDEISTYNNVNGHIEEDTVIIKQQPTYMGESFPESGLRWFDTQ